MDFNGITNLRGFVKQTGLQKTVTTNAKKGVFGNASSLFAKPAGTSDAPGGFSSVLPTMSQEDSTLLASATTKLKSGQDLTPEELAVLKKYDPASYAAAKNADDQEAREYEKTLSHCETKDDVRLAHMGKVGEIMSKVAAAMQRKDLGACMRLLEKLKELEETYQKFTASSQFSSLAENQTELRAERTGEPVPPAVQQQEADPEADPAERAADPADAGQPAANPDATPAKPPPPGHPIATAPSAPGRRHAVKAYGESAGHPVGQAAPEAAHPTPARVPSAPPSQPDIDRKPDK